jgi:cob(I)alamin adenosyltransferase
MATRIYTKTGDSGTTGLFGGRRVPKHHLRIEAYGTVDELNATLGMVLALEIPVHIREQLLAISTDLFTAGADLATPLDPPPAYAIPRILPEHVLHLERRIDEFDAVLPSLSTFILPGGTELAAHLHLARTICRRAERRCSALAEEEEIGSVIIQYLNRLSDYLFVAARMANHLAGVADVPWKSP